MMNTKTQTREEARQNILDEAQKAWEITIETPCYRYLIINSDGTCWWNEQINANECGESEFNGKQRDFWRLQCFGNPGADNGLSTHEQYELHIANDEETKSILDYLEGSDERIVEIDGVEWILDKQGDECGDAGKWYRSTGEILYWNEGIWHDVSPEDIFEEALKTVDEIPVGFFDGEEASEEWNQML